MPLGGDSPSVRGENALPQPPGAASPGTDVTDGESKGGEVPVFLLILISNKMLYLKSRVFHTLVPHVPCVTPSHKNLTRFAL